MTKASLLDDLRARLRLDRNALDDEIEQQADLFYRAAEALALAISRRDEAKSAMDSAFAASSTAARKRAADSESKTRMTEAMVKETAEKSKEFQAAVQEYLEAKLEADLMIGMRDAMDMRGKMLREMAQLYIAGYYQVAGVGGSVKGKINEDAGQRARQALNQERQNRSR